MACKQTNNGSILTFQSLCPGTKETIVSTSGAYWTPLKQSDITWNFEKFLVDTEGKLVKRYSPEYLPQQMEDDIRALLPSAKNKSPKHGNPKFVKPHLPHSHNN